MGRGGARAIADCSCRTGVGTANCAAGGPAMAIALYDLSVASYLQTLGAVVGFLEKGRAHFAANGVDLDEIVETRLFPDMLPFRFQLQSVAHHSLGAIEGAKKGLFQPPSQAPAYDYRGLQELVGAAREALQKVTPAEVNARSEEHTSELQSLRHLVC